MRKIIIGSIVGALLIFIWQFLSWGLLNLHEPMQRYTPKQDAVLQALLDQQLPDGGYFIPTLPQTASKDEWEAYMKNSIGKPWATVQMHRSMEDNMVLNMVRGYIINILTVALLCWILLRLTLPSRFKILLVSLAVGLIVFLNVPYTHFIWYQDFDIWASFADAIVSWGLCGMWLSWWLRRTGVPQHNVHTV